jgi:hypothetical protein
MRCLNRQTLRASGTLKKIVQEIIATRIRKITKGGKRDLHRLRERALD